MKTLLMLCVLGAASAFAGDFDDLQALEKQSSWEEMVGRLGDIAPAKRDATWVGLAERATSNNLGEMDLKTEQDGMVVLDTIARLMKRYPVLKQSKVFMAKRADVGFKAFGWTYGGSRHSQSEDPWLDSIIEFVKADTITPGLPQRGAKVVQNSLMASMAWPLWNMTDKGPTVCADADFKASLIEALSRESWVDSTLPAKDKCWKDIKADFTKALEASTDKSTTKAMCVIAKEKEVTSTKCKK